MPFSRKPIAGVLAGLAAGLLSGGISLAQDGGASEYVEYAFSDVWNLTYPANGNKGSMRFTQVSDAEGRQTAQQHYGPNSLAANGVCPANDADTEFYVGYYSIQSSTGSQLGTGRTIGCTTGKRMKGRYVSIEYPSVGGPFDIGRDGFSNSTWKGTNSGGGPSESSGNAAQAPWEGEYAGVLRDPKPLTYKSEVQPATTEPATTQPGTTTAPTTTDGTPPPSGCGPGGCGGPECDEYLADDGGGGGASASRVRPPWCQAFDIDAPSPGGGTPFTSPTLPAGMRGGSVTIGNATGNALVGEGGKRRGKLTKDDLTFFLVDCWLIGSEAVTRGAAGTVPGADDEDEEADAFLRSPGAAVGIFNYCFNLMIKAFKDQGGTASAAQAGGCQATRFVAAIRKKRGAAKPTVRVTAQKPPKKGLRYTCQQAADGQLKFRVSTTAKRGLRSQIGSKLNLGLVRPAASGAPNGGSTAVFSDGVRRANFSGSWTTKYGVITFSQRGAAVTGTSTYKAGRFKGTVTGSVLRGTWSQDPTHRGPKNAGQFEFRMNKAGNAFGGKWRYGSKGRYTADWSGKRA